MKPLIPVVRERDTMQVSRMANDFIAYLGAYKGYSPRTLENYEATYLSFSAYLANEGLTDDVSNFTPDSVQGFARRLSERGGHPNTVGNKLAALASLSKYAMRQRDKRGNYLLKEDPFARVERPQRSRPNRKFLHRDELQRLLAVEAPANERAALELFVDTGLRVSELANAKVEDLWEDAAGRPVLSVSVKGRGRREEKVHVPLGVEVAGRLKDCLLARNLPGGKEPLLVNQLGHAYSRTTLAEAVARLGRHAGIDRMPVRPHALRHTYNVLGRQAGLDSTVRAALLNHSDTNTVQKYDHLLPEETFEARERVRAVLRG